VPKRLIETAKAPIRRHWPLLRLRTILLLTFLFVAALPGFGALFLRVYENSLVRQTESELIAQGTALAAVASTDWPGSHRPSPAPPAGNDNPYGAADGDLSTIDLSMTPILPERPAATAMTGAPSEASRLAAARLAPILSATSRTTLASILLLDNEGRLLTGRDAGRAFPPLPEIESARAGRVATVLRHNGDYPQRYTLEWLSRGWDLRIHHARPIIVDGKVVGVLLLSRRPHALFRGLYEDRGKILLGVALIFGALVVLSGLLSRGISRPIEALSEATRGLSRGGGRVPEPPPTAAIEIQALYADFAAMADAIERRSLYLRDFAHAMSHEFKTPLTGIRGAIELLADHPEMEPADRSRFLANAHADTDRLALLVARLLDLARADMAGPEARVATDPAPVLARIADAHRHADFAIDLPIQMPARIAVPAATLEAVLTTLLENSRQAGASRARFTATVMADHLWLDLSDDGPGIAPADRARLFEPFFTTRRVEGGTGLGLAIARSLLSAAGATIALMPDAATTFRLDLPLAGG
jgi:signal transduction histidine kinase